MLLIDAPSLVDEERARAASGASYADWAVAHSDSTTAFVQAFGRSESTIPKTDPIIWHLQVFRRILKRPAIVFRRRSFRRRQPHPIHSRPVVPARRDVLWPPTRARHTSPGPRIGVPKFAHSSSVAIPVAEHTTGDHLRVSPLSSRRMLGPLTCTQRR